MENISYITRKMNIYHAFGIGDQYTIRTYNVLDILISDITVRKFASVKEYYVGAKLILTLSNIDNSIIYVGYYVKDIIMNIFKYPHSLNGRDPSIRCIVKLFISKNYNAI
jgi:hypothetical protein